MGKRAAPGDRDRIEAELAAIELEEPTLLGAFRLLGNLLGIADWQLSPLNAVMSQAAAALLAWRLTQTGESSKTDAMQAAAHRLGLKHETCRDREKRWVRESRGCLPTRRSRLDGDSVHSDATEPASEQ